MIKWEGYDDEHNTWELVGNVTAGLPELLADYKKRQQGEDEWPDLATYGKRTTRSKATAKTAMHKDDSDSDSDSDSDVRPATLAVRGKAATPYKPFLVSAPPTTPRAASNESTAPPSPVASSLSSPVGNDATFLPIILAIVWISLLLNGGLTLLAPVAAISSKTIPYYAGAAFLFSLVSSYMLRNWALDGCNNVAQAHHRASSWLHLVQAVVALGAFATAVAVHGVAELSLSKVTGTSLHAVFLLIAFGYAVR